LPSLDQTKLKLSRYLVIVEAHADWHFLSHGVFGNRRIYDPPTARLVQLFQEPSTCLEVAKRALSDDLTPGWLKDLSEGEASRVAQHLWNFVQELLDSKLLVLADEDEEQSVSAALQKTYGQDTFRAWGLDAIEDHFSPVLPTRLAPPAQDGQQELQHVRFLLLGWCFTQSVKPVLQEAAKQRGLLASIDVGFQDDFYLIEQQKPDVLVIQFSHRMLLAPLLDGFAHLSPKEVEKRLQRAMGQVDHTISKARQLDANALLLVQGVASPQTSPQGLIDFRSPMSFFDVFEILNRHIRSSIQDLPNALFVDEDKLLSNIGKRFVLDDLISTYSHHGGIAQLPEEEDKSYYDTFGIRDPLLLQQLLSEAYLDGYEVWKQRDAIRCVAVDLDNTLWPGEIGTEAFQFSNDDMIVPMMYGRYAGLHEALQILKQRGILLAVVSKNTKEIVMQKWKSEDLPLGLGVQRDQTGHCLTPDDFVLHKISWNTKSSALLDIADELGMLTSQMAFIDDHPVEREEVRQAIPEMMVLGDDLFRVRETLLTSPRFQKCHYSQESKRRNKTTKARLAREKLKAQEHSHETFLESLKVKCHIRREAAPSFDTEPSPEQQQRLNRISELLMRTNQFNTTSKRLSVQDVIEWLQTPGSEIFTMEVSDRFAEYGLVGVALLKGSLLSCYVLSCRVIGLESERALLCEVLKHCKQQHDKLHLPFIPTDRNLPATRLFQTPGLVEEEGRGVHVFDFETHDVPKVPSHCEVIIS